MQTSPNALYIAIIACEAAFWLLLGAGLAARYIGRARRLSAALLLCVPLIDVALLALTVVDLRQGASATFAHGLAAAYVGFTVAFGSMVIRWADERFAHYFASGPAPSRAPAHGWAAVRYELKLWGRCILAVALTYALLIGLVALVNEPERTAPLNVWFRIPLGTMFFWFLFGPLWSLVFFKRAPASE